MPRKTDTGLKHTKTVYRNGKAYVYFNTGEKVDGRVVYAPLGLKDDVAFGSRYSAALGARTRRAGMPSLLTVPQLVDRFQRSPDYTKRTPSTQKTYGVYLRRLAREFDTAPAGMLEASDIYTLMDEMAERPAAVDMLLLAGAQMYAWAMKRKLSPRNPFSGIDREDWEIAAYKPWPDDLLEAALQHSTLKIPVALLYYTAQRIGDCCQIKWDDIEEHPDGAVLHVTQQKTGKYLQVPIHSRLAEILKNAPRRGETVLADAKGKPAKDQTIRRQIKQFGADRGHDIVPHGLRKNAVIALLEAECSMAETSAISGQSLKMVEHYARLRNNPRLGRRAMGKWERLGNRETLGKTSPESAEK